MEELTGLSPRDFTIAVASATALILFLQSITRSAEGRRLSRVLILPALGAIVLALLTVLLHLEAMAELPGKILSEPASLVAVAGSLILALALVDLLFGRAVPMLAKLLRGPRLRLPERTRWDLAMGVLLVVMLAGVGAVSARLAAAQEGELFVGGMVADLLVFELPGEPMDIALDGASGGYLSLGDGRLARFALSAGGDELDVDIVAENLQHPRGIAVRGRELFAAELGALPCTNASLQCTGWDLRPEAPMDGEMEIIGSARGRLSAFEIRPDGTLSAPRVVLADTPVVSSEHGLNGVTMGPHGDLYLTVGNLDLLWQFPDTAEALTPHPAWMGTVLRLPDGSGRPEVFARGLRNVYEIVFDDHGEMWGVDNDGPALGGWRAEEVIQIKEQRHYGYPQDGTLGPHSVRDDEAVWLIDQIGSAGLAWAGDAGLGPGLFIGSCGQLTHFELSDRGDRRVPFDVAGDGDVSPSPVLSGIPGCVTAVEALGERELVAAVFTYRGSGLLYVIRFHDPTAR